MSDIGINNNPWASAPVPLSAAQTSQWFAYQLDGKDPSCHRPAVFRLRGELDFEALEKSLNEIVHRHEILRSVFPVVDGEPMQVVLAAQSVHVEMYDLQRVPYREREEHARRVAVQEACAEFDLDKGPMFRPILFRLEPNDHVLLIGMHHIAFDGWSESVLCDELTALYDAFSSNSGAALPPLALQYADFVLRQRQCLSSGAVDQQLMYWRKQLSGAPYLYLLLNTDISASIRR